MPEAGRIRIGHQVKTRSGKMRPDKLESFRFTSPYRDVIDQLATLYGGEPRPWNEPKATVQHQFEVITPATDIDVYIPPGGLSQWYELWPGPARRCDGVNVEVPQAVDDDDYELVSQPCICAARNERKCDVHTRLTVLIPQVAFRGSWRLETKSWNAVAEMPGVFDMIEALGGAGQTVQAVLSVRKRSGLTPTGKKRHYVVPEISIKHTIEQLQSGAAAASAALTTGGTGRREIGTGSAVPVLGDEPAPTEDWPVDGSVSDPTDDIVDAEVVSDEEVKLRELLAGDARAFGLDSDRFLNALYNTVGAHGSLDDGQLDRLVKLHAKIVAEEVTPLGFKPDGRVEWST